MTSHSTALPLESALTLLRQFTCLDLLSQAPRPDVASVREALLLVRDHSDYQIFGICAETTAEAIAALHAYLQALDYAEKPIPAMAVEGPVYLKFNPKTQLCYLDRYTGDYRGVLVSCQSAYDGDVNEMFGHLPLDLWEGAEV
jgi:hypothetical protein